MCSTKPLLHRWQLTAQSKTAQLLALDLSTAASQLEVVPAESLAMDLNVVASHLEDVPIRFE